MQRIASILPVDDRFEVLLAEKWWYSRLAESHKKIGEAE